mgnify:CR=1 FL=1
MINSPNSLAKPTVTNNYAPTPSLHLSMKLSLQRSRCVRYDNLHGSPACVWFIDGSYSKSRARRARRGWGQPGLENPQSLGKRGVHPRSAPMFTGAWLSSAALTATSLPCQLIVIAEFCGASSRLSLMPLGCMRAITHLSTSTLLRLRVKRSVIIECRKK